MLFMGPNDPWHCKLSGHRGSLGIIEAEIWPSQVAQRKKNKIEKSQVAHQGYLHLRTYCLSLNQIALGARAIGIFNPAPGPPPPFG